jgi:hypothetical protein
MPLPVCSRFCLRPQQGIKTGVPPRCLAYWGQMWWTQQVGGPGAGSSRSTSRWRGMLPRIQATACQPMGSTQPVGSSWMVAWDNVTRPGNVMLEAQESVLPNHCVELEGSRRWGVLSLTWYILGAAASFCARTTLSNQRDRVPLVLMMAICILTIIHSNRTRATQSTTKFPWTKYI